MLQAPLYKDRLTSNRTTGLCGMLSVLFFALFIWLALQGEAGFLSILFIVFFIFFLFYSLNYRVLHIHLTPQTLTLRFGLFQWDVPVDTIQSCTLDRTSLWRIGGAGIHFSFFEGR